MSLCPLCTATESSPFPIYYEFKAKKFEARSCASCGFIYVSPRPTEAEVALMYSDEYFLHDGADFGAHAQTDYETAAIKGSVKFPEILSAIKAAKPRGKFFEIGCGMGYFLNYAKTNGYDVSGLEYSVLGTKTCREQFGLAVEQGAFETFNAPPESYDVIFMGDVLEHLVNPLEMLVKAKTLLKPSGIVALEVPSMFNSLTGRLAVVSLRLLGKRRKLPLPPYHVNEFLPDTLRAMLKRAEFGETKIIQRIKPPSNITLRGTMMEKAIKKTIQYPNYAVTKSVGILGDRLLGIGIK
jgi:2-polyprenyl-3-methyl-5-hydroxy-6-metoxy-1,4-benzoquinol methylase